jgi:hypothetical protein
MRFCMLCFFIAGPVLAGCASITRIDRVDRVEVADSVVLQLPAASELVSSVDATQLVTGAFNGRSYTLQAQLEWRPGSIALAALNVWGATVFSIVYDGGSIRVQGNAALTQGLRPEYVLADILLVFADRPTFDSNDAGDRITVDDVTMRRTVSRNGVPVIVIDYEDESRWGGSVRFENLERGYVMQIQTLEYTTS